MYMQTISPAPYKGTRDFYPDILAKRNYIFNTWRSVLATCGFEEYETSVLENAEIYIAKSGEELGGSQLYNFHDKGDRFIALRPEQTPSLARLVANKYGELRMPLRWFSIPNCFRYERPQKGRLREHWQLNVDVIGLEAGYIELEMMILLGDLFAKFGATSNHFSINFNHRQVLDRWLEKYGFSNNKTLIYSTLDNWYKISVQENIKLLREELSEEQAQQIVALTNKTGTQWDDYLVIAREYKELQLLIDILPTIRPDIEYNFNPCIIRGIAYYTGIVFEAFDKNPENPRALFGGGRYDTLMDLFGKNAPAVGFGWGDVTMHEFLEGHGLYPNFKSNQKLVGIMAMTSESIQTIFTQTIPELSKNPYIIDYEIDRNENKRYEGLKKRGCSEIIKV